MPVLCLTLVCLTLVAALVVEKRQNALKEKEWALERGALLQRIQAPEVAVADFVTAPGDDAPSYVHFDEDELPD